MHERILILVQKYGFFPTFWFEFWRFDQIEITVFSNTRKKCEWRLNQNQLRNWNVWLWCCDKLCHLRYKNFAKNLKDLLTSNNFTFLLFQVRKYVRYGRQTLYFQWETVLLFSNDEFNSTSHQTLFNSPNSGENDLDFKFIRGLKHKCSSLYRKSFGLENCSQHFVTTKKMWTNQ